MMDNILKFVGIGALLFILFKKVASNIADNLSVGRISAKSPTLQLDGLQLTLLIEINNNTPVSLPIEAFHGAVKYGEDTLTTVALANPEIIPANSTVEIPFFINISFAQLSQNIISIINSGQYINSLTFSGMIRSSGVNFPVNKNIFAV